MVPMIAFRFIQIISFLKDTYITGHWSAQGTIFKAEDYAVFICQGSGILGNEVLVS